MNKKGFTLIELLAVIVVLSLILVIAIPKIGNVMDETRKRSLQQSAESLLRKAKEVSIMQNEEEIVYTIENGAFSGEVLKISGTLPDAGNIKINEDGTTEIAVHDDKFCALKSKIDDNVYVIDYDGYECKVTTPKSCFTYTKTSTQVIITNYDDACEKDVIIPSKIEGLPVTNINDWAFSNKQLTSIIIPNSVTTIYRAAFYRNQLTSVVIPSSVTSIGSEAFGINQLTSITLPNSVTSIGSRAFSSNQLTSITIPNNLTSIQNGAFSSNQLTSVVIPSSVTFIVDYAFYDNQLTSVEIPNSVKTIGWGAFSSNFLTSVEIPSSLLTIAMSSFFQNNLTSIIIPTTVRTIEAKAFESNKLTSIIIPNSVNNIQPAAFNNNQLPDNQAFIYSRNYDGSEDKTILMSYGGAKRDNIVIPSSIKNIESSSFSNNELTNITIPNSVISIGPYAFSKNQLTRVTIPSGRNIQTDSISSAFYEAYVTNNNKVGGTYTASSQTGTWTKQP